MRMVRPFTKSRVLRQSWASGESGRISLVGFERLKKRDPVLVEQDQDGIGHLGRQRLITVHVLEAMEDFRIGQVRALMNEGLTDLVVRLIVQVFRGKGGSINDGKMRMVPGDPVALNQLHLEPPMPGPFLSVFRLALRGPERRTHQRETRLVTSERRSSGSVSAVVMTSLSRPAAFSTVSIERKPTRVCSAPQTSSCRAEQKRQSHTRSELSKADQV